MAEITGYTAARMQAIEDGTVVSGVVDVNGDLILTKYDGTTVNAGYVVGPTGPTGEASVTEAPINGARYLRKDGGWVSELKASVQIFTASGTWTKPEGAVAVEVILVSGGSGGESGAVGTSNARPGAGGAGGSALRAIIPAADLAATETVTVGAGGGGGAASTTTANNPGTPGGNTQFSIFLAKANTVSPSGLSGNDRIIGSGAGGGAPIYNGSGNAGGCSLYGGGGGGSGGNDDNNTVAGAGGSRTITQTTGGGGAVNGGHGVDPGDGGGGSALIGTPGGNGAAPGGGGGGGNQSGTPGSSTAGGNGARGEAIIITYY